jgi:hypothetical protein
VLDELLPAPAALEPDEPPGARFGEPELAALAGPRAGPVDGQNARHGRIVPTHVVRRQLERLDRSFQTDERAEPARPNGRRRRGGAPKWFGFNLGGSTGRFRRTGGQSPPVLTVGAAEAAP